VLPVWEARTFQRRMSWGKKGGEDGSPYDFEEE
jgi:hypothetical protein